MPVISQGLCCPWFPKKCCTRLVQRRAFGSQQRWKSGTVWVRGINPALLLISVAEKEKWKFDHRQYRKVKWKSLWAKDKPWGYSAFEKCSVCQTEVAATSKFNWDHICRDVAGMEALSTCLPAQAPCLQPAACSHRHRCHGAPRAPLTPTPMPIAAPQQDFPRGHCAGCSTAQIYSQFAFFCTVCREEANFS